MEVRKSQTNPVIRPEMEGMRMPLNWLNNRLKSEKGPYPSIEVDGELLRDINGRLEDENGGPLLLIRPPRENDGMDASISVYETLHNPREKKVGFGPFTAIQNKAHAHAHEIWYHNAEMQFFMRPETRVDANKVKRQIRSNYRNVEIREVDHRFPYFEEGEYISVAEIGLKRDFYFPIKAKLHNHDDFDLDPYGDITSDMVDEEDETSDGQRVEAKDCKLVVQTIFSAARDVWTKSRPYGMDVSHVAQGMQEGEVHSSLLEGIEIKNASALTKKTAKIIDTLQGAKGYYVKMRVIAISPYEEIAQRRCRNVAYDFETYYNSTTQQGLSPIELTEDEMRLSILHAASRDINLGFRDRFMSNGKFLQPVDTLGAIAHIPNEDINTPVVDWAKQDTGPGTPSGGTQLEDQKRESGPDDSGIGGKMDGRNNPTEPEQDGETPSGRMTDDSIEVENSSPSSRSRTVETTSLTEGRGVTDDSNDISPDSSGANTVARASEGGNERWEQENEPEKTDPNDVEPVLEDDSETHNEKEGETEDNSDTWTPAFARNNLDDGWSDESDSGSKNRGRR